MFPSSPKLSLSRASNSIAKAGQLHCFSMTRSRNCLARLKPQDNWISKQIKMPHGCHSCQISMLPTRNSATPCCLPKIWLDFAVKNHLRIWHRMHKQTRIRLLRKNSKQGYKAEMPKDPKAALTNLASKVSHLLRLAQV